MQSGDEVQEAEVRLLRDGIIRHVALSTEDSEPFAMGATFYGQTFEQAVDTLDP